MLFLQVIKFFLQCNVKKYFNSKKPTLSQIKHIFTNKRQSRINTSLSDVRNHNIFINVGARTVAYFAIPKVPTYRHTINLQLTIFLSKPITIK